MSSIFDTGRAIEAFGAGGADSWESRPSRKRIQDLDAALLLQARTGAGLAALSDEEYLLEHTLAARRGSHLVLGQAAELLFAVHGPDHPNASVRVFQVNGTERGFGNVRERPRIEGNLAVVVKSIFTALDGLIRRSARPLDPLLRDVPEYPEYSWREAVLNALVHRDYSIEGRTTEIWFFDDRLEVSSPGGLVSDLTLDRVLRLERVHMSRNPRVFRTLVDLGVMRDHGEGGIPRMYTEMYAQGLPMPRMAANPREITVTLRHTPVMTQRDVFLQGD